MKKHFLVIALIISLSFPANAYYFHVHREGYENPTMIASDEVVYFSFGENWNSKASELSFNTDSDSVDLVFNLSEITEIEIRNDNNFKLTYNPLIVPNAETKEMDFNIPFDLHGYNLSDLEFPSEGDNYTLALDETGQNQFYIKLLFDDNNEHIIDIPIKCGDIKEILYIK